MAQAASQDRKLPIYCVDSQEKKIAISFDAAWGNEQTEELIQILDQYNVKTTFFVVGEWVDKYPESVKALADAGHEVCNHSDTHPYSDETSPRNKKFSSCKIVTIKSKPLPELVQPCFVRLMGTTTMG